MKIGLLKATLRELILELLLSNKLMRGEEALKDSNKNRTAYLFLNLFIVLLYVLHSTLNITYVSHINNHKICN